MKVCIYILYISYRSSDPSWLVEFPLHRCAFEGDAEGIKALLKSGSDVAAFDKEHWAPIHYAAWYVICTRCIS